MITQDSISTLLKDPVDVSIGDVLKESIELLKGHILNFVLFLAIGVVFSMLLNSIGTGSYTVGFNISNENSLSSNVVGFIQFILNTVFSVGYFIVADKLYNKEPYSFKHFFEGFKYVVPLLLASTVTFVFFVFGMLLFVLPFIYLAVAYLFTNILIATQGVSFWDAMEMSRKVITKKWWSVFVFLIVLFFINVLGVLALLVGLLYTLPLSYVAIHVYYRKMFQPILGEGNADFYYKIDSFGEEMKDINTESDEQ